MGLINQKLEDSKDLKVVYLVRSVSPKSLVSDFKIKVKDTRRMFIKAKYLETT